jgi:hypothetical protein
MKVAVINFSGNVGKTTVVPGISWRPASMAPRSSRLRVSTPTTARQNALRGKQFAELQHLA